MKNWTCGDCKTRYPLTVDHCERFFDDYLSLRGGSIESAIQGAVDRAIKPLVDKAIFRVDAPAGWRVWKSSTTTYTFDERGINIRQFYDGATRTWSAVVYANGIPVSRVHQNDGGRYEC